jgi:hypothetical protein
VWFLGTFPKYNKSENIPDVYQSWYSKISNQNFHIKEIVLLVAEMRAFQVINQSLKSNCFMYQLLLFWFQKCMIARYFPTNNRSESSRNLVTTHFWNQPEQHLYDIEQFVCMVSIEFLSGVFNIVAPTVSNV